MKRLILLMCAVSAGLILGCEPAAAYRERQESHETFAEAQKLLDQATSGSIGRDIANEPYGKPIHEYRREQFDAAADLLRPLANSSNSSDRIAARTLLAEAATTHANATAREAMHNASRLINTHSRLLSTVTGLRHAAVGQEEHEAIDLSDQIAELDEEQQQLQQQREEAEQRATTLDNEIATLQANIDELMERRRELNGQVEARSTEAFQADGEQQYELYVEAANLRQQSGEINSEVEAIETQIGVEQSRQALAQAEAEHLASQIEQLQSTIEALQERGETIDQLAADAADQYEQFAAEFDRLLEQLRTDYNENVEGVFSEAHAHFEEAISQLDGTPQAAGTDSRDLLRVKVQAARGNHGRAYAEIAGVRENYRNLLLSLADAVNDVQPERAMQLSDQASEIGAQAEEAAGEAEQRLSESIEQLTGMVDAAEARGNTELHTLLLRHLVAFNSAMANLTNDSSYDNQADDYREQLESI